MDWGNLILGFIIGIFSSCIVACFVYKKQKRESEELERKLILMLSRQSNLSGQISYDIKEVINKQKDFLSEFQGLHEAFHNAVAERDINKAIPIARQYSRVAGSIASDSVSKLLQAPPSSANLSLPLLCQLHKSIFPESYEFGGQLRKHQVWIGEAGSDLSTAKYVSPPPTKVPKLLGELLSWWNHNFAQLQSSSYEDRINAITEFHHRFLSIHPFLDGNGRIDRLLLGMQINDFFNKKVQVVFDRKEYYKALTEADKDDRRKLSQLIRYLVEERTRE